ncbi:MAG: PstS family phosphate ABC transporter substrate-binding protein [Thermoplasmata archaeon]
MRGENRAVSPVVATLILILIAVAAAAALYLWLVAWQGGVTAGIGSPTAQSTVSIGGSTSVYPFDQYAVTQFEQNNSDVVISNNQGGSGAGMAAVCSHQVDIGASSAPQTLSNLQTTYGCPQTVVEETVAYDAVDVILPSTNPNHIYGMDQTTLLAIYVAATGGPAGFTSGTVYSQTSISVASGSPDGVKSTGTAYAYPIVANPADTTHLCDNAGAAVPTCPYTILPAPAGAGGVYQWNQIPACTPQETAAQGCIGGPQHWVGITGGLDTGVGSTTCGWTVCGTNAANIQVWHRLDPGGTEQSFTARLLGVGAASDIPALGSTPASSYLQYSGCTGTGQLNACFNSVAGLQAGNGNPGVIAGVAGNPNAIGFASDGLVLVSGSGVIPVPFAGPGQPTPVTPSVGKTIPQGILGNFLTTSGTSSGYAGWRPFIYVQTAPPTGEVLRFIQYVMDPANSQNFATEANEVSPFQSGMAGVVPVTPIP